MPTKPDTAPEAKPKADGLCPNKRSTKIHVNAPAAAATWVVTIAKPARASAAKAEPALKPNQPTHNIAAPIKVSAILCGGIASLPKPTRLPTITAAAKPATPALMCTTVPPA